MIKNFFLMLPIADAEIAVSAAKQAFTNWSSETTAKERGAILNRWYNILVEKEESMAELLTREQGKPLAEAKGEIQYSASFLDWYAGEARRIYGQVVSPPKLNRQHLHVREPIGVVGIITPWNFPAAMIARKAGAALAAGCSLVIKPAEDTPLSALALAQTAHEAGIPKGVFNVIPPTERIQLKFLSNQEIYIIHILIAKFIVFRFLCDSPDVDCISFTGSTAVGKILLHQSANTVKRVCLELGGNAPLIVFQSADIDQAVEGTIASKFRCAGQTCVASNRFYVHSSIHNEFVEKLSLAVKKLKLGNGLEKNVNQGPLINDKAVEKVEELVQDAVFKHAQLVCGGKRVPETTIFEPTILTEVTEEMEITQAEIFGPVVAIQKFESEQEVLQRLMTQDMDWQAIYSPRICPKSTE
uniref:Succinate-semialdehyde dehydrogenase, mitochondrial n=1 Tax=Ditylenchus dipsaci TaxID=166011 RepID=A0A915DGH7_9BILA